MLKGQHVRKRLVLYFTKPSEYYIGYYKQTFTTIGCQWAVVHRF